MNHHRKYDSTIPWLFATNQECRLSDEFIKTIPKSTISDWKRNQYAGYYGQEYRERFNDALDLHFLLEENQKLKTLVKGLCRIWIGMSSVIIPLLHKDKKLSAWLVDQTQQLMSVLPKNTALRLMGFNAQSFHYRIAGLLACTASPIGQCVKQSSKQLSYVEVIAMKELFANKAFSCWPMVSLYYHGLRQGTLKIGLSTFYKYAKLLNLSRKFVTSKERKKGIQPDAPNQFLHIDTTYYHHLDSGHKAAIVFASDNFSRFITGYTVAQRNCAVNVYETLQQTIKTIHQYHPDHACITKLVTDGGAENHAISITELLAGCKKPPIQKVIAKSDIEFSNSPIEAINKICKRYLRFFKPRTLDELKKVIALIVLEYNTLRPHGSLKGLTPLEAYQNKQPTNFSPEIATAKQVRIAINKSRKCVVSC